MTNKKYQRLSPKAKNLIDGARKNFAHDLVKAREHLMSIDPSELNMYDRRKIGREILVRKDESKEPGLREEHFVVNPFKYETESLKEQFSHNISLRVENRKIIEAYELIETEDELPKLKSNLLRRANLLFNRAFRNFTASTFPATDFMDAAELYETCGYDDKVKLSIEKADGAKKFFPGERQRLIDMCYRINNQ